MEDNIKSSPEQKSVLSGKGQLNIKSILLIRRPLLSVFLLLTLSYFFIGTLYFLNIVTWGSQADFGWAVSDVSDRIVVIDVNGEAEKSGLREGDVFTGINDFKIRSFGELIEHLVRDVPGANIYEVDRNGNIFSIRVPNVPLGFSRAFMRFGFTWFLGTVFFILGVIVFFMKPEGRPSWAFLITMFNAGLYMSFLFTSKLSPEWLDSVYIFASAFLPASILHIAQTFPYEWTWARDRKASVMVPYILSLVLFAVMRSEASLVVDVPLYLKKICTVYIATSLISFFVSTIYTYVKPLSAISRIRSRIILMGSAVALVVPVVNLITILFFHLFLVRLPALNMLFFIFLPVSLSYAIAKHNLFDVDVYIKRAVGYVIMTALIGTTYFAIQVILETIILRPFLGDSAENVYPVIFALLVVFFFNPVSRKIQDIVDLLFYRKKYDYKNTVISVSNALTSLLNMDEIVKKIIGTVRKEMFIDKAGIILMQKQASECQTIFISDNPGANSEHIIGGCLPCDDPLLALVTREKKLITEYDIAEDSRYADVKDSCIMKFNEIGASIAVPLLYRNEVTGILALGHKKSGHFYTREDIYLLETLTNQGAIAIENARLAEQMKKEETVRANLSRYLSPQIVDQVVKNNVQLNLGGDRKIVTVLFSDIRNFTTITETRPPDQLIHILNEYFSAMAKIIFDNQGSLDKYIGDAIVAVFGSLVHVKNPAQNAIKAAIQMMKQMPLLNKHWTEEFGFSMDIGIGINTGEVFLGNIGSPERMEFTVIGDTVNVASRFSGLAKERQILLTKSSFITLDSHDIQCKELPPAEIKGKSGTLEVFEVIY
ncbi:MAG: GAF domain-containing protein [Nitrospiraceae bacterium]|nr:MAG: GAF domain-containing protein [Nitrospiraceae bacterium]